MNVSIIKLLVGVSMAEKKPSANIQRNVYTGTQKLA